MFNIQPVKPIFPKNEKGKQDLELWNAITTAVHLCGLNGEDIIAIGLETLRQLGRYDFMIYFPHSKGEPMSRCKDCKYAEDSNFKFPKIECCTCSLTRRVMNANAESECDCFNRDLSGYDICYNCKYYGGGGDWGLFCFHKDMYHHLGRFFDEPCKRYERRTDGRFNQQTGGN